MIDSFFLGFYTWKIILNFQITDSTPFGVENTTLLIRFKYYF